MVRKKWIGFIILTSRLPESERYTAISYYWECQYEEICDFYRKKEEIYKNTVTNLGKMCVNFHLSRWTEWTHQPEFIRPFLLQPRNWVTLLNSQWYQHLHPRKENSRLQGVGPMAMSNAKGVGPSLQDLGSRPSGFWNGCGGRKESHQEAWKGPDADDSQELEDIQQSAQGVVYRHSLSCRLHSPHWEG